MKTVKYLYVLNVRLSTISLQVYSFAAVLMPRKTVVNGFLASTRSRVGEVKRQTGTRYLKCSAWIFQPFYELHWVIDNMVLFIVLHCKKNYTLNFILRVSVRQDIDTYNWCLRSGGKLLSLRISQNTKYKSSSQEDRVKYREFTFTVGLINTAATTEIFGKILRGLKSSYWHPSHP